jgi:hypothetical protein
LFFGRFILKIFKECSRSAESQVIVEETMQGIIVVKAMNGTKLPVMTEKKEVVKYHQRRKYRGYLLSSYFAFLEQS